MLARRASSPVRGHAMAWFARECKGRPQPGMVPPQVLDVSERPQGARKLRLEGELQKVAASAR